MSNAERRARNFIQANRLSPVVYGSVKGGGRGGCFYRLEDDKTFDLDAAECRLVGHPRWAHLQEEHAA